MEDPPVEEIIALSEKDDVDVPAPKGELEEILVEILTEEGTEGLLTAKKSVQQLKYSRKKAYEELVPEGWFNTDARPKDFPQALLMPPQLDEMDRFFQWRNQIDKSSVPRFQLDDLRQLSDRLQRSHNRLGSATSLSVQTKYIVLGTSSGYAIVFDHFYRVRNIFPPHKSPTAVTAVGISSKGEYVAAGSGGGIVWIAELTSEEPAVPIASIEAAECPIVSVCIFGESSIVCCDAQGTVSLLTLASKFFGSKGFKQQCLAKGCMGNVEVLRFRNAGQSPVSALLAITTGGRASKESKVKVAKQTAIISLPTPEVLYRWKCFSENPISPLHSWGSVHHGDKKVPGLARCHAGFIQVVHVVQNLQAASLSDLFSCFEGTLVALDESFTPESMCWLNVDTVVLLGAVKGTSVPLLEIYDISQGDLTYSIDILGSAALNSVVGPSQGSEEGGKEEERATEEKILFYSFEEKVYVMPRVVDPESAPQRMFTFSLLTEADIEELYAKKGQWGDLIHSILTRLEQRHAEYLEKHPVNDDSCTSPVAERSTSWASVLLASPLHHSRQNDSKFKPNQWSAVAPFFGDSLDLTSSPFRVLEQKLMDLLVQYIRSFREMHSDDAEKEAVTLVNICFGAALCAHRPQLLTGPIWDELNNRPSHLFPAPGRRFSPEPEKRGEQRADAAVEAAEDPTVSCVAEEEPSKIYKALAVARRKFLEALPPVLASKLLAAPPVEIAAQLLEHLASVGPPEELERALTALDVETVRSAGGFAASLKLKLWTAVSLSCDLGNTDQVRAFFTALGGALAAGEADIPPRMARLCVSTMSHEALLNAENTLYGWQRKEMEVSQRQLNLLTSSMRSIETIDPDTDPEQVLTVFSGGIETLLKAVQDLEELLLEHCPQAVTVVLGVCITWCQTQASPGWQRLFQAFIRRVAEWVETQLGVPDSDVRCVCKFSTLVAQSLAVVPQEPAWVSESVCVELGLCCFLFPGLLSNKTSFRDMYDCLFSCLCHCERLGFAGTHKEVFDCLLRVCDMIFLQDGSGGKSGVDAARFRSRKFGRGVAAGVLPKLRLEAVQSVSVVSAYGRLLVLEDLEPEADSFHRPQWWKSLQRLAVDIFGDCGTPTRAAGLLCLFSGRSTLAAMLLAQSGSVVETLGCLQLLADEQNSSPEVVSMLFDYLFSIASPTRGSGPVDVPLYSMLLPLALQLGRYDIERIVALESVCPGASQSEGSWFDTLAAEPELQLEYLEAVCSQTGDAPQGEFHKRTEQHLHLLFSFHQSHVLRFLQKSRSYSVKDALQLCADRGAWEAVSYLLMRMGLYGEGLHLRFNEVIQKFAGVVDRICSGEVLEVPVAVAGWSSAVDLLLEGIESAPPLQTSAEYQSREERRHQTWRSSKKASSPRPRAVEGEGEDEKESRPSRPRAGMENSRSELISKLCNILLGLLAACVDAKNKIVAQLLQNACLLTQLASTADCTLNLWGETLRGGEKSHAWLKRLQIPPATLDQLQAMESEASKHGNADWMRWLPTSNARSDDDDSTPQVVDSLRRICSLVSGALRKAQATFPVDEWPRDWFSRVSVSPATNSLQYIRAWLRPVLIEKKTDLSISEMVLQLYDQYNRQLSTKLRGRADNGFDLHKTGCSVCGLMSLHENNLHLTNRQHLDSPEEFSRTVSLSIDESVVVFACGHLCHEKCVLELAKYLHWKSVRCPTCSGIKGVQKLGRRLMSHVTAARLRSRGGQQRVLAASGGAGLVERSGTCTDAQLVGADAVGADVVAVDAF